MRDFKAFYFQIIMKLNWS